MKKILATALAITLILTAISFTTFAVQNPVFNSIEGFDNSYVWNYAVGNQPSGCALGLADNNSNAGPQNSSQTSATSKKLTVTFDRNIATGTPDSWQQFYVANPYFGATLSGSQPDEIEMFYDLRNLTASININLYFTTSSGESFKLPNTANSFTAYKQTTPGGAYTSVTCGYGGMWINYVDDFKGFIKYSISDFKSQTTGLSLSDITTINKIYFGFGLSQMVEDETFYLDSINFLGANTMITPFSEKSISSRITDKDGLTVFQAWNKADNVPSPQSDADTKHDFIFNTAESYGLTYSYPSSYKGLSSKFTPESIVNAQNLRKTYLTANPNMLLLSEVCYHDAPDGYLDNASTWWRRDGNGNRVSSWSEGSTYYLDWTNESFKQKVVDKAVALVNTGVIDGIFLDWWQSDDYGTADNDSNRLDLISRIRTAIGSNKLIVVNSNQYTVPNTAQYINGLFMECYDSTTASDWTTISSTLSWAESNVQSPKVNLTEVWYSNNRNDLSKMRATTTLSMIYGNGYTLFSDPNDLVTADHLHDWYAFWDTQIGLATSTKIDNANGTKQREYTNGTAIYNPLGNGSKTITFDTLRKRSSDNSVNSTFTLNENDGDLFLNTSSLPGELLSNSSFENTFNEWSNYGNATVSQVSTPNNLGNKACLVSNRTSNYSGVKQDIKNMLLTNGQGNYYFEGYLETASSTQSLCIKICINDDLGNHWYYIYGNIGNSSFTKLSSTQNLTWSGTLNSAIIYTESSSGTENYYVDDLSFRKVFPELLNNPSFEQDTTGWSAYNSCSITPVNWPTNSGSKALKISNRASKYTGVKQDIKNTLLTNGQGNYSYECMIRTAVPDNQSFYITICINDGTGNHWYASSATAAGTGYVKLATSKNLTWTGTLNSATIYMESSTTTIGDYYVDDLSLKKS